ncbi:HalOD1 output domain-containing protein [Natronococcus occultus]|uniref:Halobacterial output domain-containing protein n=1 Tax=Natronococcus occultus SP4 TaxID=694430 RepID=L0K0U9_9EURY|nr:HalOD1 output domain-containing protein [Natronococcus occultus]AGB38912.1 hypothetical protein Natoc_3173 [Natronococcus occultus SP4]
MPGATRIEREYGPDTAPTVAVLETIAALEDVDATTLGDEFGLVLHDHLDPAALDAMFTSEFTRASVSVTIEAAVTYDVTITPECVTVDRDA